MNTEMGRVRQPEISSRMVVHFVRPVGKVSKIRMGIVPGLEIYNNIKAKFR